MYSTLNVYLHFPQASQKKDRTERIIEEMSIPSNKVYKYIYTLCTHV